MRYIGNQTYQQASQGRSNQGCLCGDAVHSRHRRSIRRVRDPGDALENSAGLRTGRNRCAVSGKGKAMIHRSRKGRINLGAQREVSRLENEKRLPSQADCKLHYRNNHRVAAMRTKLITPRTTNIVGNPCCLFLSSVSPPQFFHRWSSPVLFPMVPSLSCILNPPHSSSYCRDLPAARTTPCGHFAMLYPMGSCSTKHPMVSSPIMFHGPRWQSGKSGRSDEPE